jgi:hypothetical protein
MNLFSEVASSRLPLSVPIFQVLLNEVEVVDVEVSVEDHITATMPVTAIVDVAVAVVEEDTFHHTRVIDVHDHADNLDIVTGCVYIIDSPQVWSEETLLCHLSLPSLRIVFIFPFISSTASFLLGISFIDCYNSFLQDIFQ